MNSPETATKSSPQDPTDKSPSPSQPSLGWTSYAERINGRFAMIGFIGLLILEWFTHQDFFTWLGLR